MGHKRCTCIEQVWIDSVVASKNAVKRELEIVNRERDEAKEGLRDMRKAYMVFCEDGDP
jgi:hypothetical protein